MADRPTMTLSVLPLRRWAVPAVATVAALATSGWLALGYFPAPTAEHRAAVTYVCVGYTSSTPC